MYDFLFLGNHFSVLQLVFYPQFLLCGNLTNFEWSIDLSTIHYTELIFLEEKKNSMTYGSQSCTSLITSLNKSPV